MLFVFFLLVIFQIKHLVCDYFLQTPYMLGKFKPGWDWVLPLTAHAGVHLAMTTTIALIVNPSLWWLGLVDFVIHFTMDRIKASPNMLGRFKALSGAEFMKCAGIINETIPPVNMTVVNAKKAMKSNKYFWYCLGLDQMVHHLTDLLIVYILVS